MENKKLDNKIAVPNVLSFLTYQRWDAEIKGLNEFDQSLHPTNVPGLYYSYHIMVGLGYHIHQHYGSWSATALAEQIVSNQMVIVDHHVYDSISIHREYCRLVYS
jgi:cytochrome bd-type quinol oxidase subunit 1